MPERTVSAFCCRHDLSVLQRVAHDPVIDFSVKPILVEADARAAVAAFCERLPETLDDVGLPVALVSFSATGSRRAGQASLL